MSSEKISQLESILAKRSGTALPPTHQIMLDLKQELSNLYDTNPNLDVLKRLEFVVERLDLIDALEGPETDSRLKGFLLFRKHNLLVAKVAYLQRKKALHEADMKAIGLEIGICLTEAARILRLDQGCPTQLIETIAALSKKGLISS